MGEAIDRLSKLLASGASRRETLGEVLAGAAALLPWTAAANDKKKKRRERRKIIKRTLESCQCWCNAKFNGNESAFQSCLDAAKNGDGPCYSAAQKGPGHYCLRVQKCGDGKYCCPEVPDDGGPVTEGPCCPKGTSCEFLLCNGTVVGDPCTA